MNTETYLVQEEDTIRQQIHIPEYLAEVLCKFPRSTEKAQSPSKHA